MSGIVTLPVVATFATELPDTVPIRALPTTAAFAGPPTLWPASANARSSNMLTIPDFCRIDAKIKNSVITDAITDIGTPNMPLSSIQIKFTNVFQGIGGP